MTANIFATRWPWRRESKRFAPTVTGWGESTHAELAWRSSRGAAGRWGIAGAVVGIVIGLIAFAPASWLAQAVGRLTDERLILAEARGTVWSGSAIATLTGGPGSRDAATLPGRLSWSVGWRAMGAEIRLTHACCLAEPLVLGVRPGLARFTIALQPSARGVSGRWPAFWLSGLGTPWNTLALGGEVRLASPGLTVERVQGRWRLDGRADIELHGASSRIATIEPLGSYRFSVQGDASNPGTAALTLTTLDGALLLNGNGTWSSGGVRFRGEASAKPGDEAALANLLNIIGRRSGARSVIAIG